MDLERLIERFRGPLVGLIASLGASWGDAIELAQDVFAEAYLGRERFDGTFDDDKAVGRWLGGIARNLHRAGLRASERRRAEPLDENLAARAVQDSGAAQRHELEAALAALAPDQRAAVQMFYLEGSSLRVVAGLLGVSAKTVEGRLYRARRELRRRLSLQPERGPRQELSGGTP